MLNWNKAKKNSEENKFQRETQPQRTDQKDSNKHELQVAYYCSSETTPGSLLLLFRNNTEQYFQGITKNNQIKT
jgi:hypothetical protein